MEPQGRGGIFSRANNEEKVIEERLKGKYLYPGKEEFGWNRRTTIIKPYK